MKYENLNKAVKVIRALNHELRQRVIKEIYDGPCGSLTVTEIQQKVGIDQSVASQHLAILRNAGIVTTKRDGKHIYYSVNKGRVNHICDLAGKF